MKLTVLVKAKVSNSKKVIPIILTNCAEHCFIGHFLSASSDETFWQVGHDGNISVHGAVNVKQPK